MSQTTNAFDFSEQQRVAGALLANTLFPPTAEALLATHASLFVNGESVLMAWMNRRHEAILEAQRLFARMRECRDLSDAMQAQQEWMSGALRRLSADAASCRQAMDMLVAAASPDEAGSPGHSMEEMNIPANDGKPAPAPAPRVAPARAAPDR